MKLEGEGIQSMDACVEGEFFLFDFSPQALTFLPGLNCVLASDRKGSIKCIDVVNGEELPGPGITLRELELLVYKLWHSFSMGGIYIYFCYTCGFGKSCNLSSVQQKYLFTLL